MEDCTRSILVAVVWAAVVSPLLIYFGKAVLKSYREYCKDKRESDMREYAQYALEVMRNDLTPKRTPFGEYYPQGSAGLIVVGIANEQILKLRSDEQREKPLPTKKEKKHGN